jgi:transketolase
MATLTNDEIAAVAKQLRVDSIRSSTEAGSGHPTSSMSAADLIAVLAAKHLRYDWSKPDLPSNDHLIFSKGHASPLLYSLYRAVGVVSEDELLTTYRRLGARLQGHPTPQLPWVDLATGSLGLGIAAGVGVALAGKYLDKLDYRVWILCGDSETAEGSVWEALDKASHYELSNFTVLFDVNRLGQRGPTELEWDLDAYARRVEAFGCAAIEIDGHDIAAIDDAMDQAETNGRPTVIIAKTIKGKGVAKLENALNWHGVALKPDDALAAVEELGGVSSIMITSPSPDGGLPAITADPAAKLELPTYNLGDEIATRTAYGDALVALKARPEVVVLDAEVGNSTGSERFHAVAPERYFEAFIAEQLMVAAAGGLAVRGYVPFASTFGAFFSRAADFVRMLGISGLKIRLAGSHAGVEIGADGPSQMALEDLAIMRSANGSVVLYPSDATSTVALTVAMADAPGVAYLRTTRGAYPVVYPAGTAFRIGGAAVVRSSTDDAVTLIGAGVTLHECLAAAEILAGEGIAARVVDCYSVKPLDLDLLTESVNATGGRVVIAEDHFSAGGLGEAIAIELASAGVEISLEHLCVRNIVGSGTPKELLDEAGISAPHIAEAARKLTKG